MESTAGDRYRIEVRPPRMLGNMFGLGKSRGASDPGPQARERRPARGPGGTVNIVDLAGEIVWSRACRSRGERDELIKLIETHVLTARLKDFQHRLRPAGADGGGL
jgi:hypothetical protein